MRPLLIATLALIPLLAIATAEAAKPQKRGTGANAPARARDPLAHERDTIDGAVAASLISALSEQLGGHPVKIRLDRTDVVAAGIRDRIVRGLGQVQIDGAEEWLGFRFSTLYDSFLETAGPPELSIGGAGPEGRAVPNDPALLREVEDRVVAQLAKERGDPALRLQLDRIATLQTGTRYLRIDADGIADFGRHGTAPLRVEGLYDRKRSAWLPVAYSLNGPGGQGAAAVR